MKTCKNCNSVTFDDMESCFDCMSSFVEPVEGAQDEYAQAVARIQVVLAGYFSYELLLQKLEGRSLSVGSANENAIVIPQEIVAERQLEVFYAHGRIWAENIASTAPVSVDESPINGIVCIEPGSTIQVGDANLILLKD